MESIDQKASSSNSSNSNSTQRTWKYDIFLSFRGKDTRKSFTDHLYHALNKRGFRVFRDDRELERGEVISVKLLQAIEDSLFAVVVLSRNYASSPWCLNELQHILYSRDNLCQQVFPIFYGIDPSDVRHQRRSFAEAFARHQMLQRNNRVMESWRDSLTKVANLSGWDCNDQPEAELIDTVVEELWTKLRSRLPPYCEDLIGIHDKVQRLEPLLEIGLNGVRFIGLWGLGGVGKTTIARAVFEKYRSQFDISCFLLNVRATSLERDGEVHLQRELLSHLKIGNMKIEDTYEGKKIIQNRFKDKKVLLILDDVSHPSHFEILANSPDWFGAGSRVIVTTRDSELFRRGHKVYKHEVKIMNSSESLQLFCQKAFRRGEPQEDLLELSKTVCDHAKGLPLALSVLGSYFCGRSVSEWEDTLDMLEKDPHKDIIGSLEISFHALTNTEKPIFLDIACFFSGWRKDIIIQILESFGFNNAKIVIKALQGKSMLKDYFGCLVMHDFLVRMGRKIVLESSTDVGHRTRLWSKEDIDEVMENNLGTKEIQGMVSSTSCEACWDSEAFSTLHNLRLLIVTSDFNLPHGLKCLPHSLKVLHWTKYPLDILPPGARLYKLVDIKMRHSKLKKLWNKSLCSLNLKFLDLSYSKNLIETPDFSELQNLERLELEGCEALVDLHASMGQLKKVQVLNLKGCKNLRARCLKKLEMSALKEFVLCGCIRVKYLPEFGESMKNLEMLDAGETNLVKLPESLGLLSGLKTLKLRGCKNLVCLPKSIHKLKRLVLVDIAGCSKFVRLPEKLNEMEALEEIDSSETDITEVPSSISGLKKVKKLSFQGCKRLTSKSWSLIHLLNFMFGGRSTHDSLTLPASIFNYKSLKNLNLSYCNIDDGSIPYSFGGLSSLRSLNLSGNKFQNLPAGCISNLLNLKYLSLNSCSELRLLPQSGPSLGTMHAKECGSLEKMSDKQLSHLFASIDQARRWMNGETLGVTISGSEIPSWFENQIDLCLDDSGKASMMIDTPPCDEEMLGIGLCIVLDDDLFYSTGLNKRPSAFLQCWFDFAALPDPRDGAPLSYGRTAVQGKSSHLWMMFWKQREELSRILQLSEYSHIPVKFRVNDGKKLDKKVSVKCGWRVISKRDFENKDNSMSHNLLPAAEQHNDQAIRTPMPLKWESRSISVRWPDIVELDDFWKHFRNDRRYGDLHLLPRLRRTREGSQREREREGASLLLQRRPKE